MTAISEFLSAPQLLNGDTIPMEAIHLDGMKILEGRVLPFLLRDTFKGLKSLSMEDADLTDEHVGVLTALISAHTNLSSLRLTGNDFSADEGRGRIIDAWNHRGLTL